MRFGTLQLCDEHARQSAAQTSTKVDPFYAAIWSLFNLRLTDYLTNELGYESHLASGIVGNIFQESGFNPTAIGDGGNAFGLFQYNSRLPNLKRWARQNNRNINDWRTQLDFMNFEVNNDPYERSQFQKVIRESRDPSSAALAFSKYFERPNAKHANNKARMDFASSFYNNGGNRNGRRTSALAYAPEVSNTPGVRALNRMAGGMSGVRIGGVPIASVRRPNRPVALAPRTQTRSISQPRQLNDFGLSQLPESGVRANGVALNDKMNPLVSSLDGASRMTRRNAPQNLDNIFKNQYIKTKGNYRLLTGKDMPPINDAIAKDRTTREHNTPGSQHFHGKAIDFSTRGMSDYEKLAFAESAQRGGFSGAGFGETIYHADTGPRRAWKYGNRSFGGQPTSRLISNHNRGVSPLPDRVPAYGAPIPKNRPENIPAPMVAKSQRPDAVSGHPYKQPPALRQKPPSPIIQSGLAPIKKRYGI